MTNGCARTIGIKRLPVSRDHSTIQTLNNLWVSELVLCFHSIKFNMYAFNSPQIASLT